MIKNGQNVRKQSARKKAISKTVGVSAPALVFISHDTRDAAFAEAFSVLLSSITCGILKTFRSSDKSGSGGLEYGSEWYPEVMTKIDQVSDVVCLLTERSLGRPWILYEAGVAKGKLGIPVHGLALGVPLAKAATGPFVQFQNCADDSASLSKLVTQLAKRLPNAVPEKSVVKKQVAEFLNKVAALVQDDDDLSDEATSEEDMTVKLFEEVKVMFQELPEKMENRVARAYDSRANSMNRRTDYGVLKYLQFCSRRENPLWFGKSQSAISEMTCLGLRTRDEHLPRVFVRFIRNPQTGDRRLSGYGSRRLLWRDGIKYRFDRIEYR